MLQAVTTNNIFLWVCEVYLYNAKIVELSYLVV